VDIDYQIMKRNVSVNDLIIFNNSNEVKLIQVKLLDNVLKLFLLNEKEQITMTLDNIELVNKILVEEVRWKEN